MELNHKNDTRFEECEMLIKEFRSHVAKVNDDAETRKEMDDKIKISADAISKNNVTPTPAINNLSQTDSLLTFAGGSGTQEDPYKIGTTAEFLSLSSAHDATIYFALVADINFINAEDKPVVSINPIGTIDAPFSGHLFGDSFSIKNFVINSKSENVGLFGYASNAEFKDFTIENCEVEGVKCVGALIGNGENCLISNIVLVDSCKCTGTTIVGGLAGQLTASTISNCASEATIMCTFNLAAGLVASLISGSILDCKFFGQVTGEMYTGGICGKSEIGLTSCINNGTITGTSSVGGISGALIYTEIIAIRQIRNCFNTGNISGTTKVGGIAGMALSVYNDATGARLFQVGNSGNITASESYSGGIIGDAECAIGVVGAYNIGNISGGDTCGGIFGRLNIINTCLGVLMDCYNLGKVANVEQAGLLIGYNSAIGVRTCLYLAQTDPAFCTQAVGKSNQASSAIFYNVFSKTSEEIKTSVSFYDANTFSDDTNNVNSGYPILLNVDYSWIKRANDEKNYLYATILNGWLKLYRKPTLPQQGRTIEIPFVESFVDAAGHTYEFTDKNNWYAVEPKDKAEFSFISYIAYAEIIRKTGEKPIGIEGEKGDLYDENGYYWAAVGPKVPFPDQKDDEDILPINMYAMGLVNAVLKNEKGELFYLPLVIGDAKAHTWTNGVIQTYKEYPTGKLKPVGGNFSGAVAVEFYGKAERYNTLDFTGCSNFSIDKLLFFNS